MGVLKHCFPIDRMNWLNQNCLMPFFGKKKAEIASVFLHPFLSLVSLHLFFFLFILFLHVHQLELFFLWLVYMYLHTSESRCWKGEFLTKTHLINSPQRLYQLVFCASVTVIVFNPAAEFFLHVKEPPPHPPSDCDKVSDFILFLIKRWNKTGSRITFLFFL